MSGKEGGAFWKRQKLEKQKKLNAVLKKPRFSFFFTKSKQDSIPTSTSLQDYPIATVSGVLEAGSSSCRDDSSTANSDPLCDIELPSEKSSPERQILVDAQIACKLVASLILL
uniref:Uncharacterized protein LOC114339622 n=1 Tax=Diabrotica virgifera virgifera TaxID=50390 RepID=A0A6P7G9Z3_DIAVI